MRTLWVVTTRDIGESSEACPVAIGQTRQEALDAAKLAREEYRASWLDVEDADELAREEAVDRECYEWLVRFPGSYEFADEDSSRIWTITELPVAF